MAEITNTIPKKSIMGGWVDPTWKPQTPHDFTDPQYDFTGPQYTGSYIYQVLPETKPDAFNLAEKLIDAGVVKITTAKQLRELVKAIKEAML